MRKVIIAFDGTHYSEGAMTFAKKMNLVDKIVLTGLFLPQLSVASLWSYSDAMTGASYIPLVEDEEAEEISTNISRFNAFCSEHGIHHTVEKAGFDLALPELRKETRFADLVILGGETFYEQVGGVGNEYLKDALHLAECPVIVVPENYKYPENNILAYDGSESSVFAIKQFMYLFPEFSDNPTVLVTTNASNEEFNEKKTRIHDLVSAHFSSLSFLNLEIDARKYFATWISEKKASILVCGAFSRSIISQMLRQSFVEEIIRDHRIPLFVSHR